MQTFALHKLFINWYKWNSIWNSQKKIHYRLVAAAFWFLQKSNVKVLEKRSSNKILRLEVELCNLGIGQRYSNTWSPTANGEMTFNNNGKISMNIAKDHFVNQETKLLSTSWQSPVFICFIIIVDLSRYEFIKYICRRCVGCRYSNSKLILSLTLFQ